MLTLRPCLLVSDSPSYCLHSHLTPTGHHSLLVSTRLWSGGTNHPGSELSWRVGQWRILALWWSQSACNYLDLQFVLHQRLHATFCKIANFPIPALLSVITRFWWEWMTMIITWMLWRIQYHEHSLHFCFSGTRMLDSHCSTCRMTRQTGGESQFQSHTCAAWSRPSHSGTRCCCPRRRRGSGWRGRCRGGPEIGQNY